MLCLIVQSIISHLKILLLSFGNNEDHHYVIDMKSSAGLKMNIPNVRKINGEYLCMFANESWNKYFCNFIEMYRMWLNNRIKVVTYLHESSNSDHFIHISSIIIQLLISLVAAQIFPGTSSISQLLISAQIVERNNTQ